MKKRFKSALFAFFKEEIMNEVSIKHKCEFIHLPQQMPIVISEEKYKIITIEKEVLVKESYHGSPFEYMLDDAIMNTRRAIVDEAMKHVSVNSRELFDTLNQSKIIKATIHIGVKSN